MKHLIITAILFVAVASTGFAQLGTGIDASFTTHGFVLSTLSVTNTQDLDFFNVIQGADKTVEANIGTGNTDATYGTGQLADFDITGTASKEVGAYLTSTLSPVSGVNTLTVANWVAWTNSTDDLTGATAAADPTSWANRAVVTLDAAGAGYMWLGATAQPTGAQPSGDYTVDNTFTFYYTGN